MLGLPKTTELNKQLPKNAIYAKFQMNTAEKNKIDADISRITIVNEVSASKMNIQSGEQVHSFFVLHVILKRKNFDEKSIITLTKLIPQNMVLLLEFDGLMKLAVYYKKLLQTDWKKSDILSLELKGLNMDAVWEQIIVQIGHVEIVQGNTLDEQITIDEQHTKLQSEIERLTRQAKRENQPKKKFKLAQRINSLKNQLEDKS